MGTLARKELMRSSWVVISTLGRLPENISSHRDVLLKNLFLKISQNSQENTRARVSILIKPAFLLRKVFSCEFCKSF